jgi:hypothetical protein
MNTNTSTETARATGTPPATVKVGLVLAGLLGLADIAGGISQLTSDALLPMVVAATAIGLGVLTVVLVPFAWRGAGWASWTIIGTRAVSAMTALPAFFVPGVPAAAVIAATVGIALAVLAIALMLVRGRAPVPAGQE